MEQYDEKRRFNDILIDKGIRLLEENLNALNELKNRFNLNERDHQDVKELLITIQNNTFDILNKMNNEKIIDLLENSEDVHNDFKYKWNDVYNITKTLNDKLDALGNLKGDLDVIKGTTIQTKETFGLVQKVLFVILSILIFIQIIATAYRSKEDVGKEDIEVIIERGLNE